MKLGPQKLRGQNRKDSADRSTNKVDMVAKAKRDVVSESGTNI